MRIRINPILKKDVKVTSRSMKMSWGIFAYEGILTIIFLSIMTVIFYEPSSWNVAGSDRYSSLVSLFPTLSIVQICIVSLVIPIITASSISGEKERQTFDIMITTSMSSFAIIAGKVSSAVIRIMLYVIASVPIMALSFVLGGLKWSVLLWFIVLILTYSIFAGSIGIFCSAICKKSISAIILSYLINGLIYFLTSLPLLISVLRINYSYYSGKYFGEKFLPLLFNPIVMFEEFYAKTIKGTTGMTLVNDYGSSTIGNVTKWVSEGNRWIVISAVLILVLSIGIMLLAAKKINPLKSKVIYVKPKMTNN